MDQVNSDNSTTTPAVSTRRRFLSQAAGVAAGGAVLALATVSATGGATAPMAALAPCDPDPIFALIEDYRTAAKTVAAAASEVSRREEMMIEQGLGTYPVTCVLDAAARGKPMPTMAYSHEHIDQLLPPDRFSKANAEAKAALDIQIERNRAAVGDSEDVLYAAQDAETEAVDTLIWTVPTSRIIGIVAGAAPLARLRRRPSRRYHNLCYRRVAGLASARHDDRHGGGAVMTKALAHDDPIRHRYGNIIKAPRAGLKTRTALIIHQRGITKKQLAKFYVLHGKRFDYIAFAKDQNINLDWFTFGILALHPRIPAPAGGRARALQGAGGEPD